MTVGGVAHDTIRNIENVTGGSGNDTLTGDSLANIFKGGAGNDVLDGGADFDTADFSDKTTAVVVTLNGGTNATATVGGVAQDTLRNIENVIGGSGNDTLTGDSLANSFEGGSGTDVLAGKDGDDNLTGGANADTFFFDTALSAATNVDYITDFATEDTIQLENAVFTGLPTGTLAASAFFAAAGATAAADADDRIIYNTTTGDLYFDADGSGGVAAVQFAVLDAHPSLTNVDFLVV